MRAAERGFTLLEMLVAIGTIILLAALSFPAFQSIMASAERAVCTNNLRNLRLAFSGYASSGWPQLPEGIELGSRAEEAWWLEWSAKELGLSQKNWQCPTIRRLFRGVPEKDRPLIHYLPTPFSGEPDRANKSAAMPWFIEIGNAHGGGNLLVLQKGDVRPAGK